MLLLLSGKCDNFDGTPQTVLHIGKKLSLGESRSRVPIKVIQSGENKGVQQNEILMNITCPGLQAPSSRSHNQVRHGTCLCQCQHPTSLH